jgi:hypothetical protein
MFILHLVNRYFSVKIILKNRIIYIKNTAAGKSYDGICQYCAGAGERLIVGARSSRPVLIDATSYFGRE